LRHDWLHNSKPNKLATNSLKYLRIDAAERDRQRQRWNRPDYWPLALVFAGLIATILGVRRALKRRENAR